MSSVLDKMTISDFEAAHQAFPLAHMPQSEKTMMGHTLWHQVGEDEDAEIAKFTLTKLPSILPNSNSTTLSLSTAPKRQKCPHWCVYACHSREDLKSPWALSDLLGEINIQYNGLARVQCNCLEPSWLSVIYRFPVYLLRRYIAFAVQFRWTSPELLLRVPRIVPWDHKLWRYLIDGNVAAVKRIYTLGLASPHDISQHGTNSLYHAISSGSAETINFLLDQGVDCNHATFIGDVPSEMLWDRAFGGHYDADGPAIVRRVLQGNGGTDDMGFSVLHMIILGIMYKDIRTVLEATTDSINVTDSRGRTPMHWAVICDNDQAVQTLLEFGVEPNLVDSGGYLAIDFVRSVGICKSLLKANPQFRSNPLKKGRGVLHNVVKTGPPSEVVGLLVSAGADINALNFDRETQLLNAIYYGRTEMAERLIALGADVNIANISSHEGPIHFAGSFDRPDILPLLVERGANYTAANFRGWDLGHCAALFASVGFVDDMVQLNLKKLNLDKPDQDGKTAKDYMNVRIIMKDQEIGIHEAFETLAASLSPYSRLVVHRADSLDALESQVPLMTEMKPPGAFPSDE